MIKQYHIQLPDQQRAELEHLIATGTHKARVLARARVLLLADQATTDKQIVAALGLGIATVQRTRKRFVELGLPQAIYDLPRPGRPPLLTGEIEAKLVMLACSAQPSGRARWTLHLLADKMVELHYVATISHQQVSNILKKTNLSLGGSKRGASPRPMRAS